MYVFHFQGCGSESCPAKRRGSEEDEVVVLEAGGSPGVDKLTCISEEGIADMDLPDNLLDDLDYIGDCITSCNKVENYLMLSEFENNLIAERPVITDRRGRRWSLARHPLDSENARPKWKLLPNRLITVIDEASD